jgi:hypothetical protein
MSAGANMTEKITTAVSYAASGTLMVGGLAMNELVAIIGLILAIATFAVNIFYKRKHLQLAQRAQDRLDQKADK